MTGFVRMIEPSLGQRYRVRANLDVDIQPVFADPTQLENALVNLVLNARDAMPAGGEIVIDVRNTQPRIRKPRLGRALPGTVTISVEDQGTGMEPEIRDRAMEPFFTTKTLDRGTGLGLSSVAGFVRQSKGDISIESTPGVGTTVTLKLPAAARVESAADVPATSFAPDTGDVRVLLVEDFAEVRAATASMLKSLGYQVLAVAGPEEALEIIRSEQQVDLVLTDILLSDEVTGVQLARLIQDLRPEMPVAFVSGWVRQESDAAPDRRARVLAKPFTRHQLDAHIQRALAEEKVAPVR